jgi:hypothetical protein
MIFFISARVYMILSIIDREGNKSASLIHISVHTADKVVLHMIREDCPSSYFGIYIFSKSFVFFSVRYM